LVLGAGGLQGIRAGDSVIGPGGLIGRVESVTPTTARVALLTDSSSKVGVWVGRTQRHGLLTGVGSSRPVLRFLEKDPQVRPGDVVVTSPASTLVPPGLSVGVIQSVDDKAVPATLAVVQLSAPVASVDWVQVLTRREAAPAGP
jgi:rod shape-determining protein MreC